MQRPMKPLFNFFLSSEGVEVRFHDADCLWAYAGSFFIDPIICLAQKNNGNWG